MTSDNQDVADEDYDAGFDQGFGEGFDSGISSVDVGDANGDGTLNVLI